MPEGSLRKTRSKKLNSSKLLSSCPVGFMNNVLESNPKPLYFCFPRFLLDLVYGWETTVKRKGCFMYAHAAWGITLLSYVPSRRIDCQEIFVGKKIALS